MKQKLAALFSALTLGVALCGSANAAEEGDTVLTLRQQQLTYIGMLTAEGSMNALKAVLDEALSNGMTVNEARDAIVQLYAYTGFPRSLAALDALAETVKARQAKGLKTEEGRTATPLPAHTNILALGTKTQTALVGHKVDVSALSPDIDRYLKAHLFGDIFASDLLNWQEREILTIGALTRMILVRDLLDSHIAIGKRNGLSDRQIDAILRIDEAAQIELMRRIDLARLSQFDVGDVNPDTRHFNGLSHINRLSTRQLGVSTVTFEPGVRNNRHIHRASKGGGQILIVTAGRGYYQEWGKPARELNPGDTVNIPANVKHWHGAAKNERFQHLAIEVPGENTRNEWLEPVSDKDYAKLK